MQPFNKVVGPNYKDEYKRKHRSKFLSDDPEVDKRFGVFEPPKLLKKEDAEHFKNLYPYNQDVVEQYKLPEEKKEKEQQLKKAASKIRDKSVKNETAGKAMEIPIIKNVESKEEPEGDAITEEDEKIKNKFIKIFDPHRQREEMKEQEVELYVKKGSKTDKTMKGIDNGEKAVQFFAMFGNTTPIKFIFCIKRQPKEPQMFSPYDLEVIPSDQVKDNYFVITPSGISHVYPSNIQKQKNILPGDKYPNHIAEFYTLSDWMYQSTLFNILRRINYFKKYLPFKLFTMWRNFNRFNKFQSIRGNLSTKLFFTKPAFVEKMIQCNKQVNQITKTKLHRVVQDTPYSNRGMSDFDDEQKKVLDLAKGDLKKIMESDVLDTLRVLYKCIYNRLKEVRGIDEDENSKTLQELKNKSMYNLKIEKKMRRKLIKLATKDKEVFDKFVTMVDYLCEEKLYELNRKNLKDIKSELVNRKATQGAFTLTLEFKEAHVTLQPTAKEMEDKFNSLFKGIIECITDAPRLISIFFKKNYDQILLVDSLTSLDKNALDQEHANIKTNDSLDERIKSNFRMILETSNYHIKYTHYVLEKLSRDYRAVYDEVEKSFQLFIPLQDLKDHFILPEYIESHPKIPEVKKKMDDCNIWISRVENYLKAIYTHNILSVNASVYKEESMLFLKQCKEEYEKYIKKKYMKLKKDILEIHTEGINLLDSKRNSIPTICEFKEGLNAYQVKLAKLKRKVDKLVLIKHYNIELSAKDQVEFENTLKAAFIDMDNRVKQAYLDINHSKEEHLPTLYKEIEYNKNTIKDLNDMIVTSFLDVNTNKNVIKGSLKQIESAMKDCINLTKTYNNQLKILEAQIPEDRDDELEKLKENFETRNSLWMNVYDMEDDVERWKMLTLNEMKTARIDDKLKEYIMNFALLNQKIPNNDAVLDHFGDLTSQMNVYSTIIQALSSTSMQDRHWKEVFSIIKAEWTPDALNMITFGDLMGTYMISNFTDEIDNISAAAIAQEKITKDLEKIEKDWSVTKFVIMNQSKQKNEGKYIISTVEEIMNILDEHSQLITSALSSRHVSDIRAKVNEWDETIMTISRVIEEWLWVQKQWIYLENIFSAEDIKKQLPDASKNFSRVNKGFKDLMHKTNNNPLVIERCKQEGLLEMLIRFRKELDSIQKSLEDYLQTKRKAFPRFYFLSNDELLKILSNTRQPRLVNDYLTKCFDGIKCVTFISESSNEITEMNSPENEVVVLSRTFFAHENIEAWLNDLEEIMFTTVYDETKRCLDNYPAFKKPRREWIYTGYPCQSVITIDQVMFGIFLERVLIKGESLPAFLEYMESLILELSDLVKEKVGELKKSLVERLVIINVHSRDVVKEMIKKDVKNKNDFEWQKILKFYWEENKNEQTGNIRQEIVIKQTNSRFIYGYEYLGNPERMVITPLTDRCYITLTSALNINFGGAPAGPAGTGKTETTKDLSKALAIKVNVFNCTDQLDISLMGRMFCGLAECGAWACFDEFNRIEIEVLSVIAQQIEIIQTHLREKKWNMIFEGKAILLKPRFGVFITMNPGYAGRTELPDNLKSLFRPVAMMIPDYALVAEVTLYSKGFKTAKELSVKMYQLFKLSSEQLSKQKHYDFGLRGIKSILTRAGYLKEKMPNDPENEVLIRAMKDSNLPKFLEVDIELFLDIIQDLFPNVVVNKMENKVFVDKVKEVIERDNLKPTPKFVDKVGQLLDTMMVRLGNMIVGLTGTGKSTCYQILQKTLTELGKVKELAETDNWYCPVKIDLLNPKSVPKSELYMAKDEVTQTWEDGIVARIMRTAEDDEKQPGGTSKRLWLVFDGPVDATWIEDMNTVLDDSRKLCLPDSSNIRIPKMMNLIFEVQDLKVASPATVSRCGMVYLEPQHVGIPPIIESWGLNYHMKMRKLLEEELNKKNGKEKLEPYFKQIDKVGTVLKSVYPKFLNVIRTKCKEKIPSVDINLVQSCLNLFSCFLQPEIIKPDATNLEDLCSHFLIFSMVWSFGANLEDDTRIHFSRALKEEAQKMNVNFDMYDIYEVNINIKSCVFYKFNSNANEKDVYKYDESVPFFNILIPTNETIKFKEIMGYLSRNGFNSLFMGETGVGKSVIIMDFLKKETSGNFLFKSSNFSAKTSSKNVFDTLKLAIYKNGNFAPPAGKKFIYFIDDINLPQLDLFGSQQPIEFIRQLIDNKMLYDEKKTKRTIKDSLFIAACAPPSGGRNHVTPRLFRHFNMIWMTDLSIESMKLIFKTIVESWLSTTKGLIEEAESIVEAGLEIYNKIRKQKLPTPSKSHYTFNLRDMSKVIQGMVKANLNDITDKKTLINLWIHETSRQFRDRLLGKDVDWFDKEISDMYELNFKQEKASLVPLDKLIFTEIGEKSYKMVSEIEVLAKRINDALDYYNISSRSGTMTLVFFTDAINHFCRIARILNLERGNALLVGLGGSGRQSLTRLVVYTLKQELNYLQVGKGYVVESFLKDIGKILMKSGFSEKKQTFLFSDTQILFESFLEDINNILNNGEVPNLFKEDELTLIFNNLKDAAKNKNFPETRDGVYQYFVSNVRDNLHIVLSFSPVGAAFRNRCIQFPSIINCCSIDWFNIWPDDALKSVAQRYFKTIGQTIPGQIASSTEPLSEEVIAQLSSIFVKVQTKALELAERFEKELRRNYYITPTSYLEFIKLFLEIYNVKLSIIPKQITNYKLGIQKLEDANDIVKKLKEELLELEPKQKAKKREVEELIVELDSNTKKVEIEREKIKGEKDEVDVERNKIFKVKEECDADLQKAKPKLDSAKEALSKLDENDIKLLRSYISPSENILNLGKNICFVFDCKGTEYTDFKGVVQDAKQFKLNCQNEEMMVKKLNDPRKLKDLSVLWKLIADKDFSMVNLAAMGLKAWVGALLEYVQVYRAVKPKMDSLEKAKKELAIAEEKLFEKSKNLREKEDELKVLQDRFDDANHTLKELNTSIDTINTKSKRATRLVDGLREEGKRWKEKIISLEKEEKNLLANVIISSTVVSYFGPFTTDFRKEFMKVVIQYIILEGIHYSNKSDERMMSLSDGTVEGNLSNLPDFSIQEMLSDPLEIREWNYAGLPADDLSIENAIITVKSKRWPLIIDPQMQANKWIKNYFRSSLIRSYKITDKNLFTNLKLCIVNGFPALVENVEQTLDSSLEPILQKVVFKQGAAYYLSMGTEKPIQYVNTFKLFMTSKLSNPHYLPEISIKVTLINFTVTLKGLEDQLLVEVVKHEKPELEAQKDTIILSINEGKKLIKDLEQSILNLVKDASSEILENDILVNKLDQSKVQSVSIKENLETAETTARKIQKERISYHPIAVRGSIIYFAIASLANVDSMYNYSLDYFLKLFNQRLQRSEKSLQLDRRVDILINDITISFYEKISRGLFEKDKLLYSFLIVTSKLLNDSTINQLEWNYFLRGPTSYNIKIDENHSYYKNGIYKWFDLENYKKLLLMKECCITFFDLENILNKHTESDIKLWKEFFNSDYPHAVKLPDSIEKIMKDFYKLILIKSIREEKLIFAIKHFIEHSFDKRFLESPPFSVSSAYEDSLKTTPLIFILSPGANPVIFLRQFAREKQINMINISLGQGQGEKAKQAILRSKDNGDWVCLENCHLSRSWMPKLEEILEEINDNEAVINSNYRLWLTSMPSDKFPASVLQSGVKITNEPPKGIKSNLKGTYANIKDEDFLTYSKPVELKKLTFGLAFFHAIILERRKFGPLGWNIPYEWMNSDFEASRMHLNMYVEEFAQTGVPFEILRFLIGTINYGGRVTDDKDSKLISAILAKYYDDLIFDDLYKFSESGIYFAPKIEKNEDVFKYLEKLPLDDEPEVFGLHNNANITLQNKMVREFMEPLIGIQPRTTSAGGTKPDDIVLELKADIDHKFAQENIRMLDLKNFNPNSVLDKNSDQKQKKSPLGNFLLQECEKLNTLLNVIEYSTKNLELAVKGTIVMSPNIEQVYHSFLNGQVPKLWEDNAYLSLKPLISWIYDFIQREKFMASWLYDGPQRSYWISAFFFPQGFNTAVLQTYARKTRDPIDKLTFRTNVLTKRKDDESIIAPDHGLNIHGLYLQGASWNWSKTELKEQSHGELWQEMPVIWLEPCLISGLKKAGYYECPLYKTSRRAGELSTTGHSTNFVMYFYLKCDESEENKDKDADHWIRRGAALLTQLDN